MIKNRSIAICIILSIVTCGIYGLYWMASEANDVNTITNDNGTSGGMVVLLSIITCNIYYLVWLYNAGKRLDDVRNKNGERTLNQEILYLLLAVFGLGLISLCLIQDEINRYADAGTNQ